MQIREHLVKPGTRRRKGTKLKSIRGVTIHNTGNTDKGANADRHAKYQANTPNEAVNGWHYTVDENEAVLSIPENEVAEHAGKREGNDTTVGIEICEHSDGDLLKATDNAAKLAAEILKRQGFKKAVSKENLWQHNHWSGKDCPSRIRRKQPYDWDEFVRRVNAYMAGEAPAPAPTPTEKPSDNTVQFTRTLKNLGRGNYMKGADVKKIQERLIALGYDLGSCGADGTYGGATEKAVKAFKVSQQVDGNVDLWTWNRLFNE